MEDITDLRMASLALFSLIGVTSVSCSPSDS